MRSSIRRLTAIMRAERPHILHTHTAKAGALARAAALVAGNARPPIVVHTFHGHVLKGYFGPGRTAFFRQVERNLARSSDVLVAVSPEVRDELVAHGIAPTREVHRDPARHPARGATRRRRPPTSTTATCTASPRTRSSSAGSGA